MTHRGRARITRRPAAPILDGVVSPTLDGLLAALDGVQVSDPVVADLSLGAWRSHEIAWSCFSQLALDWPLQATPPSGDQASTIGDWIDSEGRGDSSTLHALALAEALLGELDGRPLHLVVVVPRFGLQWEAENLAFLRFIAHGVRPGDRLLLASAESAAGPIPGVDVRWSDAPPAPPRPGKAGIAALVSGALDPHTSHALGAAGHPLGAGWMLTPPEWRRPPASMPRLEFDRLAAAAVEPWLRASALVHGNNIFVDPWFLCAEANRRLAEGGHGIALKLLERAATCARSQADRGLMQSLAQGFRIALLRYEEVVNAPDPSASLEPALRGALLMTKGWGFVMTAQGARAEPYMREARTLLEPVFAGDRSFLYLLNISALNRVHLGDLDGAMALEKQIESASAALDGRDDRLDYVNSINIARLHRRRDEFELAARYYDRAFSTTAGARTESDHVYTDVCYARLDAARRRDADAFLAWMRATLHWLAADAPEALGWRVLTAILGRKALPVATPVEVVAEALCRQLRAAADSAGIAVQPHTSAPAFLRSDRDPSITSAHAFGTPGFSVFASTSPHRGAVTGPHHDALAALTVGLVAEVARAPMLLDYPAVAVDDALGRGMATTRDELLATCLRLGVRHATFAGETGVVSSGLLDRAVVEQGPAVARIDNSDGVTCVQFRRYLPPLPLSAGEACILARCPSPWRTLERALDDASVVIRTLESARAVVVTLQLP